MLALDNGDAIRGDASVVSKIDYTLHGVVSAAIKQLADGQLGETEADLYAAIADATIITAITLVNTDTSTRTVNLYLKPSGGASRRIIPKDCSLPAGYSLATDGVKVYVMSTSGAVVVTNALHAASHTDGTDDIRDATAAQKGVATAAQITKLDGIAAGADVTADNAPKAHKDSHDPIDGGDKLDTAIPVKVGAANAIGSSHSLSRADHVHEREHAKYTDGEAVAAMGAKADDNPLHHDKAEEWGATEHTAIGNNAPHHTKYTNNEAKAAAVQAGAITDGVTKAPTHDAVYDVKQTADAALPAASKYTNAEAVSAVEAAGLALASGKNIKVISALTADHTWSGLSAVMTAGIALVRPQAVYAGSDGKMEKALATAAATMPAIALATGTIAENASGEFLMQGFFRDDTWDWTPGGLLYISRDTAGALTQTLPAASGEQVQVVGVAVTADIIYFNPSLELVEIS